MKKVSLFIILCFLSISPFAQNFLSPVWKISFSNISETNLNWFNTADWKDVNLLLSWERQGYYGDDGNGCIVNEFLVQDEFQNSKFVLTIGLQCDIKSIYINGKLIGGNLPNQFWSNRGAKADFILPDDYLNKGKQNQIAVFISHLSYTGGISVNFCSIAPKGIASNPGLKIEIPAKDHLYSVSDANSFIIKYNAAGQGKIKLSIVNDFHQSFVQNEYKVEKGKGTIQFNFKNVITQPGFMNV